MSPDFTSPRSKSSSCHLHNLGDIAPRFPASFTSSHFPSFLADLTANYEARRVTPTFVSAYRFPSPIRLRDGPLSSSLTFSSPSSSSLERSPPSTSPPSTPRQPSQALKVKVNTTSTCTSIRGSTVKSYCCFKTSADSYRLTEGSNDSCLIFHRYFLSSAIILPSTLTDESLL